jgi:hypothetical protein
MKDGYFNKRDLSGSPTYINLSHANGRENFKGEKHDSLIYIIAKEGRK